MTAGYAEFEFDLPGALLKNLIVTLDKITPVVLTKANAAIVPEEQGVYQLFLDKVPVYVGKTDAEMGLQKRLFRHGRKILHRKGLDPSRVSYKAVRVFVFTAMDMEGDLIRHYGGVKSLSWNGSGFGSNDPGRNRDNTKNKPSNFDYMFPINIDLPLDADLPGGSARSVLKQLNNRLPYTLRFDQAQVSDGLSEVTVGPLVAPFTAREAIVHVVTMLPPGWQATKLLGYVILYPERKAYPDEEIIART